MLSGKLNKKLLSPVLTLVLLTVNLSWAWKVVSVKVRAGNLNTALNDSSDSFDPWESGAANEDALQLGKIKRVDDRKVSVRYDTPVLGGFSASVQYQPRDNANPGDKYNHAKKSRDSYGLGLNYENSGFFGRYAGSYAKRASLDDKHLNAFSHNTALTADIYKDHQAHRLTAGYDANNLMVAVVGQYEGFKKDAANAKKNERTEVGATAAYRFGNVTPRVSYAHGFKVKEEGVKQKNSAYNQVIVGADYDFSKRTSALLSSRLVERRQRRQQIRENCWYCWPASQILI